MRFADALQAKIDRIKAAAAVDIGLIQAKADADVAELQAILDTGENWLQKQSDVFYSKVAHVMDKIREN